MKNEKSVQLSLASELQDFAQLYNLLRALAAVQEEASFYERLHLLLLLARWTEAPLTLREIGRQVALPIERLSVHLARLRSTGWLTDEDRVYTLSTHGRLLIFVLRLIAQPWGEKDSVPVLTQLYQAASSQELALGPEEPFFEYVVAAIEESLRRLRRSITAEQTTILGQYHQESMRNVLMADTALSLRQAGTGTENDDLIERMHHAISALLTLSGQLEVRHLTLVERDLLTSGQVALGDVQSWAAHSDDYACAAIIASLVEHPIPQPSYIRSGKLLAAEAEVNNQPIAPVYRAVPTPQAFHSKDTNSVDTGHHPFAHLHARMRQRVGQGTPELSLAEWVNHPEWYTAVAHLLATLDSTLQDGNPPIYLHLSPNGTLTTLEQGAVLQVSDGIFSTKEHMYDS